MFDPSKPQARDNIREEEVEGEIVIMGNYFLVNPPQPVFYADMEDYRKMRTKGALDCDDFLMFELIFEPTVGRYYLYVIGGYRSEEVMHGDLGLWWSGGAKPAFTKISRPKRLARIFEREFRHSVDDRRFFPISYKRTLQWFDTPVQPRADVIQPMGIFLFPQEVSHILSLGSDAVQEFSGFTKVLALKFIEDTVMGRKPFRDCVTKALSVIGEKISLLPPAFLEEDADYSGVVTMLTLLLQGLIVDPEQEVDHSFYSCEKYREVCRLLAEGNEETAKYYAMIHWKERNSAVAKVRNEQEELAKLRFQPMRAV